MKNYLLYFTVFGLVFLTFSNPAQVKKNEEPLADKKEYSYNFSLVTEENRQIVLFDNSGLPYSKYYVYHFTGDKYILYTYYYMTDNKEYLEKYEEIVNQVVDYNYDELMIKTIENIGNNTYAEIMDYLKPSIEKNNLYILY